MTQLLLDKLMLTVAGLLFISEGAYEPLTCAGIFPESEIKLMILVPSTHPFPSLEIQVVIMFILPQSSLHHPFS